MLFTVDVEVLMFVFCEVALEVEVETLVLTLVEVETLVLLAVEVFTFVF